MTPSSMKSILAAVCALWLVALIISPVTPPLCSVDLGELLPQNVRQDDVMPQSEWPSLPPARVTLSNALPASSEDSWLIHHVIAPEFQAAFSCIDPQYHYHQGPLVIGEVAQSTHRSLVRVLRV